MQKQIEEKKIEIISSDANVIELREIIVHKIILDNNEFEKKHEELELAKIAKQEAEQKINNLELELADYTEIYKQLEKEVQFQSNDDEETNE